jgi:hypothetical protein
MGAASRRRWGRCPGWGERERGRDWVWATFARRAGTRLGGRPCWRRERRSRACQLRRAGWGSAGWLGWLARLAGRADCSGRECETSAMDGRQSRSPAPRRGWVQTPRCRRSPGSLHGIAGFRLAKPVLPAACLCLPALRRAPELGSEAGRPHIRRNIRSTTTRRSREGRRDALLNPGRNNNRASIARAGSASILIPGCTTRLAARAAAATPPPPLPVGDCPALRHTHGARPGALPARSAPAIRPKHPEAPPRPGRAPPPTDCARRRSGRRPAGRRRARGAGRGAAHLLER